MNFTRLPLVLTVVNLVLLAMLLCGLVGRGPAARLEPDTVLRARTLELVDDSNQVRSSLKVEPGGDVVLRLLDRQGTIRVKLGASEFGSGLVLLDEATEPAVRLVAQRQPAGERAATTSLTLTGADGQQQRIAP